MSNQPSILSKSQLPATVRRRWYKRNDWATRTFLLLYLVVQCGLIIWIVVFGVQKPQNPVDDKSQTSSSPLFSFQGCSSVPIPTVQEPKDAQTDDQVADDCDDFYYGPDGLIRGGFFDRTCDIGYLYENSYSTGNARVVPARPTPIRNDMITSQRNNRKKSLGQVRLHFPRLGIGNYSDTTLFVIRSRVRDKLNAIRTCYERRLRSNPKLAGWIKIRLKIGARGWVISARVVKTSPGMRGVGSCVARKLRRIRFPKSPHGKISVTQAIQFRPRPPSLEIMSRQR